MNIVFKKSVVDKLIELVDNEVYLKNRPTSDVDYIEVTEDEARELADYIRRGSWYPYKIIPVPYKSASETVHNCKFYGFTLKVKGYKE